MMLRFRPGVAQAKSCGVILLTCLVLAACGNHPKTSASDESLGRIAGLGTYKLGKPYQVAGVWYYPAEDPSYDVKGIASWYGPNFHEKYTANGEIFDQNGLSAAHKTLPLPSIVQVTNLDNGRSIKVRINDRGPFVGDRVIDMSRRAAQLLGFERQGTAKVEVRYIMADSLQAQSIARNNGTPEPIDEPPPTAVPSGVVVATALSGSAAAPVHYTPTLPVAPPSYQATPSSLPPPPPMPSYAAIPSEPMSPAAPESLAPAPGPAPIPASQVPSDMSPPPQTLEAELAHEPKLPQAVSYQPVKPSNIYIQAGAFRDQDGVMRTKAMLDGLGHVTVTGITVNGQYLYRVRLGPIATVQEADKLLDQAHAAGATDAKLVVN
jgi:rare lipoprotein A